MEPNPEQPKREPVRPSYDPAPRINNAAPPPLAYATPGPPPGTRPLFLAGLIGGTLYSGTVWAGLANLFDKATSPYPLLALLGFKVLTGFILLFFREWRRLGAGILTSLITGFMIFFCVCAANIKF